MIIMYCGGRVQILPPFFSLPPSIDSHSRASLGICLPHPIPCLSYSQPPARTDHSLTPQFAIGLQPCHAMHPVCWSLFQTPDGIHSPLPASQGFIQFVQGSRCDKMNFSPRLTDIHGTSRDCATTAAPLGPNTSQQPIVCNWSPRLVGSHFRPLETSWRRRETSSPTNSGRMSMGKTTWQGSVTAGLVENEGSCWLRSRGQPNPKPIPSIP